jgi:hypothetical protein
VTETSAILTPVVLRFPQFFRAYLDEVTTVSFKVLSNSSVTLQFDTVHRDADKFLAFPISYFHICSTTKRFFLDGLKKLEQQSHKCVEHRGEDI